MTGPARLAVGATGAALLVGAVALPVAVALVAVVLAIALANRAGAIDRGLDGSPARRLMPVALGASLVCARVLLAGPAAEPLPLPTGSGPWVAVVETVGSPRDGTRPAVIVLDRPPGVRLAASLPWYPEVAPGDHVRIEGTPEAPPPGGGYTAYLRRLGASGTIRARALGLVMTQASTAGPTWDALRAAAANGLERSLPEPEGGLAAGILVGLRDRVDRDLAAAFTTAGVSHIVAISGWNIAIVATTLGALTGRLGRRRRTIATGVAIAAYVAFVGPSPSVVRAGAMAGCALLARELGRPTGAMSAMGLAVAGLTLLEPANVTDPGFQLSVLATAGLISWGTTLTGRLAGPTPGRLRAWLAESLGVSLAAQAATLPAILLDFGRLSLVSPVVNLLVAPLVAPAMAAGALALIGGLVALGGGPAGLATLAGLPAWALLGSLVAIVRLGASLPFASVTMEPPLSLAAAGVSAVALLAVVRGSGPIRRLVASAGIVRTGSRAGVRSGLRGARTPKGANVPALRSTATDASTRVRRTRRAVAVALGAASLAVGLAAAHRPDGVTRVTVLDVGQGDAILVEGGAGSRLLVDGGPDPGRLLIALDERLPPWDRRIDEIVLTHPHEDHVGGLAELLSRYRVSRVFEPGMVGPGPGYAAWESALAAGGPTRWALGIGDRLTLDSIDFRVLWPVPGSVPLHPSDGGTAINNVSIVLLGEVDGHRFLLTGDMEQAVDSELLTRGLPGIELLKVAHHGSATASTEAFLAAAHPALAVISVGAGNPFGHPATATLSRLRGLVPRVLRTDSDGSVTVTFDGPTTRVRTSGGRHIAGATTAGAGATAEAGAMRAASGPMTAGADVTAPDVTQAPRRTQLPAPSAAVGAGVVVDLPHPAPAVGPWSSPRYHRPDDGPVPGGGGAPAPVARPTRVAPSAFTRRRRDRELARASSRRAASGRGRLPGPAPPARARA